MKRLLMVAASAVLMCAAQAQAPAQRVVPTLTRTVMMFSEFENQLLDAAYNHDAAGLDKLLDERFEMRVAGMPGRPTARAEAIQALLAEPPFTSHIAQMATHEYPGLMVVSYLWTIEPGKDGKGGGAFFVVDTWRSAQDGWKLSVRYAAPSVPAAAHVPGSDTSAPAIQKKM